jgi:hypothetical protein
LIVATDGVAEDHVPPVAVVVKVVDPAEQIEVLPLIVPELGAVLTVTVAVVDAFAQPPVPETV